MPYKRVVFGLVSISARFDPGFGVGPLGRTVGQAGIDPCAGLSKDGSPWRSIARTASSSSARSLRSSWPARRLHGLAKRHDISRNLIRVWVQKYEAGVFDEDAAAADLLQQYEARIAALERLVGKQALELEFLKGALQSAPRPRSETTSVIAGPAACVAEGCRLMGMARSTFYDNRRARRHCDREAMRDLRRVRRLWLPTAWRRLFGTGRGREPQEDPPPDARA